MDSRDDKVAANLSRQSLSAKAALRDSGESCPDPEILAAYFDRSLAADETAHFESHLSRCLPCREQLAAMHRVDESAATHTLETLKSSSWGWVWNWRWLAPAAVALIILGVWVARRPMSKSGGQQQPIVAMSASQNVPPGPANPARDYRRDETAAPQAEAGKQASREFSAADKLSLENPQPRHENRSAKDQESGLASNRRGLLGGSADLKKQNEPPSSGSSQADDDRTVAGPREPPVAAAAGTPVEPAAQSATVESEANSIGPQAGAAETRSKQAPVAARLSTDRLPASAQAETKALALQAVERHASAQTIKTPDPRVLWRIAEGRFVERSTDGGGAWKAELSSVNAQLTAGFAPSADVCWVVGRRGAIFLTIKAGDWRRIQPPVNADFTAIAAKDALSATVTTADGRKFTTTDSGARWNPAP